MSLLTNKRARPIRRSAVTVMLALIGAPGLEGCADRSRGSTSGPAEPAAPVSVATAVRQDVPVRIRAVGWVEAYQTVTLRPRIDGQLTDIHFIEGQEVKTGDVLFTLDKRPYEAALRLAEADLARDRAMAKDADRQTAWTEQLFKQNVAAERERDQNRADAEAKHAQAEADEAAVDAAKLRLEYCTITAPFDGRIGSKQVDIGSSLKANDTAMVVLNQVAPIHAMFPIPEGRLPAIKQALSAGDVMVDVMVPGLEQTPERGKLTFVDNQVDATTGMIRLKATLTNEDRALWPGLFVNVALTVATRPAAVVVPSQAIQNGQHGQFVFVIKSDHTADMRTIVSGESADGLTEMREGINEGDVVATDGQLRLTPGARVQIKTGDAKLASGAP